MDRPLAALLRHLARHRRTVWAASACSVLNKIFDLAPPVLIGMAVDTVVEKNNSFLAHMGVPALVDQLIVLAVLTLIIWGFESLFEYLLGVLWRNLAQTVQHELRLEGYEHVQALEMAWFEERSIGRLLAILNDDVNQLERFLDGGANALLQLATTVLFIGGGFLIAAPQVAVLAMLPIPIILWGSLAFQKKLAPRYQAVREKASQVAGQLANNLSGIETIKSFTAEQFESERLAALSDAYRASNREAIRLSSAFSPLIRMVIVVGFTVTLVYGGYLAGEGEMSVGLFSAMVFMIQRLLWPLTALGQTLDLFQRAMASTQRVLTLLHTPIGVRSGDERVQRASVAGELHFQSVCFAYPDREPVLKDFNLTIAAGETVAIVGPTGAGKSTLIRLLLRFYDPQAGTVSLDGMDLREAKLDDLRDALGLVSQSTYLFSGSVRDNIAYARPAATDDAIESAAVVAEAAGFIEQLPDRYDTVIGERGQKLSGGQRQRLSIARAVLKDPPVLLLDEATSAVDNETEAAIQKALQRMSADRTTLIIAHRLSTIRHADRIIVLNAGVIVEEGQHDELVAAGGLYTRLWNVQTGNV
jgi:ATP-binding cassette, subfamily B, bacterial